MKKNQKKDPKIFLGHILESIEDIETYSYGKSKEEFFKMRQLQDALVRRLEVIGEATRNLPQDIKDKYNQVEWQKIAGLRDVLIHEYFGVNLNTIWIIIKRDIPAFKKEAEKILQELENQK